MAMTKVAHPSVEERKAKGKAVRELTPLASHSGWTTCTPSRPGCSARSTERDP